MVRIKLVLALSLLFAAACAAPPEKVRLVPLDQELAVDRIYLPPTSTTPPEAVSLTLAEAQAALPFELQPPAWLPAGFQMSETVNVTADGDGASASLSWQNAAGDVLDLAFSNQPQPDGRLAAAGVVEPVAVHGLPASLRRVTGLGAGRLILSWTRAGVTYRLAAPAQALDAAALVRVAESIP